jgi:hypothetical protein
MRTRLALVACSPLLLYLLVRPVPDPAGRRNRPPAGTPASDFAMLAPPDAVGGESQW